MFIRLYKIIAKVEKKIVILQKKMIVLPLQVKNIWMTWFFF